MKIMIKLMSFFMGRDYRKQLPSGDSQQQGGDNGVRQTGSPRKQEKPDVNLQVMNKRTANKGRMVLYDPKEYKRRVNDIVEGQMLVNLVSNTRDMLGQQIELLSGISLDEMRNNSRSALPLCSSKNKLVNQDMSIEPLEESNRNVETVLSKVAMEWFPVKYHLLDKVALVVFTVLGYYTGKHHLDDDLAFLWLVAGMPVLIVSVMWGINELMAWMNGK